MRYFVRVVVPATCVALALTGVLNAAAQTESKGRPGEQEQKTSESKPPTAAQDDKVAAPKKPETPAAFSADAFEDGLPAALSGFADEGVFYLYKNEERLATCKFKLEANGRFETNNTLAMAGQRIEFSMEITPDADGRWKRIDYKSPQAEVSVDRDGTKLSIKRKDKEDVHNETTKQDAVLFENFTPVFMSQAIRRYDRAKGGKQEFPLIIVPAAQLKASLEFKEKLERTVGGHDLQLSTFTYALPGVDVTVWADAAGKVYFADVPAQRAAYVREGFEALRKEPVTDPTLSQPTQEIIEERGAAVPMRDGIKLSTDIYRPKAEGKYPVVLIRTPYKKEMSELDGKFYARRGYVAAIQDVRGRFGSPGEWQPFVNEKKDGYDAIEWLAAQPWSSGKVGMIGGSYLGWVQWLAASQNPPHLVTIIPNVSPPDPFYNFPYEYGTFFLWGAIWWADVVATDATADLSGAAMGKIMEKKYAKILRALPVIDLDKAVLGKENAFWRKWIEHNSQDAFWEQASHLDYLKDVKIPVFHQSGWFDGDGIGSKLNYLRMASHGRPMQKLVLGPWGHVVEATRTIGDHDFGADAAIDLPKQYLRWFDHWLKGVDNGIDKEPLVSLFVMGDNKWLHGDKYPLPQTKFEKWYLASAGGANTSTGDGKLTRELPAAASKADKYTYDPGDPTPNPSNMFADDDEDDESDSGSAAAGGAESKAAEKSEASADGTDKPKKKKLTDAEKKKKAEAHHEEVTKARQDILVYATEPLDKPLTFVGPMSAVLYASSSAKDTDWFVRVLEVEENGKLHQLAEGKIRARFRESVKTPKMLEPGKVYEYAIDLWQTGNTIPAGSRLRIEVASASFPFFSRNLNTGGHNEKDTEFVSAEQVIYHDAKHPSHILLPVIPEESSPAGEQARAQK